MLKERLDRCWSAICFMQLRAEAKLFFRVVSTWSTSESLALTASVRRLETKVW
eukprot:Gb_23445 [translate_table: standard]